MDLALEFGISEEEVSDLVKDGVRQIKIFRIWLKKGPQTWKNLVDLLRRLNEKQLADELEDKVKRKGSYIYSSYTCVLKVEISYNIKESQLDFIA